jgi:hypothetical protein
LNAHGLADEYLSNLGFTPDRIRREMRSIIDGLVANEEECDENSRPLSNSQLRAKFTVPSMLEKANRLRLNAEEKTKFVNAARDIWNEVFREKEEELNAQMAAPVLRLQALLSHPIPTIPALEALNEFQKLWARYSTKNVASLS